MKEDLIKEVRVYKGAGITEQKVAKKDVLKLFKKFWLLNPTEKQFYSFIERLVIFPEMIYFMVVNSNKK